MSNFGNFKINSHICISYKHYFNIYRFGFNFTTNIYLYYFAIHPLIRLSFTAVTN
jgi:hypothetical protein